MKTARNSRYIFLGFFTIGFFNKGKGRINKQKIGDDSNKQNVVNIKQEA